MLLSISVPFEHLRLRKILACTCWHYAYACTYAIVCTRVHVFALASFPGFTLVLRPIATSFYVAIGLSTRVKLGNEAMFAPWRAKCTTNRVESM